MSVHSLYTTPLYLKGKTKAWNHSVSLLSKGSHTNPNFRECQSCTKICPPCHLSYLRTCIHYDMVGIRGVGQVGVLLNGPVVVRLNGLSAQVQLLLQYPDTSHHATADQGDICSCFFLHVFYSSHHYSARR